MRKYLALLCLLVSCCSTYAEWVKLNGVVYVDDKTFEQNLSAKTGYAVFKIYNNGKISEINGQDVYYTKIGIDASCTNYKLHYLWTSAFDDLDNIIIKNNQFETKGVIPGTKGEVIYKLLCKGIAK